MLKKLRIKFVCILMTIVTIMLVIILSMVIHFTKTGMEQSNIQMMQDIASNPLNLMKITDDFDVRLPYFSLRLNGQGELLETSGSYYDLSDEALLKDLVNASFETSDQIGILNEYNLRFMRVVTPTSQFLIFSDISNEITTIESLTRNCILIGIFSFFVFLGISIFLANWAVKPVDKAWKHQKQFIADASHELKTPLTVILTNAELLQDSSYDAQNRSRFSNNILIMANQMRGLVESLLDLSRIDNGSMKNIMNKLNFSALLENSLYFFEPLYFESGLELISDIEPDIWIKGSDLHLKQVAEILLDNALKYAAPHSPITITLHRQHLHCTLSVNTYGTAISNEDLENIFKRFYQIDKSRSASGSYGLGLSIARNIIKEHHGKIWAESKNGINTFFVRLTCC